MYKDIHPDIHRGLIDKAYNLLSNPLKFAKVAKKVTQEWKCSSELNLTNTSRNRRAWLGQASCCFSCHVPEDLTKIAWRKLSKKQQDEANETAELIIKEWEYKYKINKSKQSSFGW